MNSPELLALVGTLIAMPKLLITYLKYGIDTASKRHAHYRFVKEFFADLLTQPLLNPIQLEAGYAALGGPKQRPAREIKHVLELAERIPEMLNIHARAALCHVRFNEHLHYFEWDGPLAQKGLRSAAKLGLFVCYVVAISAGWMLIGRLLQSGSQPSTLEFWYSLFMIVVFLGCTGVAALFYVVKINFAIELVNFSKGEIAKQSPVQIWWRSVRKVKSAQTAKAVESRSKRFK